MRKLIFTAFFASVWAFSQSPTEVFEKAPPQIDSALRSRVATFFQAHIDGKFRQAEQVIHEDSKDAFYNGEKQKYFGFEIARINYSDNFTKAVVIAAVDVDWVTPRLGRIRVKPPMKSLWKLEDGQWWWYVIPQKTWDTPFGPMRPGEDPASGVAPKMTMPDIDSLLNQVRVNRRDVHLKSAEVSEDYVEFTNATPGDLTLVPDPASIHGLNVTVDKPVLHEGEVGRVTFKYVPPDRSAKPTSKVIVRTNPLAQAYEFILTFDVAPEHQKHLPKQ